MQRDSGQSDKNIADPGVRITKSVLLFSYMTDFKITHVFQQALDLKKLKSFK